MCIPAWGMFPLSEDTAGQFVYVRLFDSTDHITPEEGVTSPTITVSKNGADLAAVHDGTWNELADVGSGGSYSIRLDATDTETAGPLCVRVVKAGCDDAFVLCHVRTNTEAQVAAAVDGVNGKVDDVLEDTANLDVAVSTRAAPGDEMDLVDAPNGTAVTAIQSGLSTHSAADVWSVEARTVMGGTVTAGTVSDKTGYALAVTPPTASDIATAVDGLSVLDNLDVAVSTRAAPGDSMVSSNERGTDNAALASVWTSTVAGRIDVATSTRSSHSAADVWSSATRTLTSFGTLASDVWSVASRTLSAFGFTPTPSNAADTTAIRAAVEKLDDTVELDDGAYRFTALALAEAPTGGGDAPTVEEIDAQLSATHGSGMWGGAAGDGVIEHTETVQTGGGVSIADVLVWFTTDLAGSNKVAQGRTDAFGQVTFYLDAGTYYAWKSKYGVTFTNPQAVVVD